MGYTFWTPTYHISLILYQVGESSHKILTRFNPINPASGISVGYGVVGPYHRSKHHRRQNHDCFWLVVAGLTDLVESHAFKIYLSRGNATYWIENMQLKYGCIKWISRARVSGGIDGMDGAFVAATSLERWLTKLGKSKLPIQLSKILLAMHMQTLQTCSSNCT